MTTLTGPRDPEVHWQDWTCGSDGSAQRGEELDVKLEACSLMICMKKMQQVSYILETALLATSGDTSITCQCRSLDTLHIDTANKSLKSSQSEACISMIRKTSHRISRSPLRWRIDDTASCGEMTPPDACLLYTNFSLKLPHQSPHLIKLPPLHFPTITEQT